MLCHGPVSVCPCLSVSVTGRCSVSQVGVKRLNIGSHKQHTTGFSDAKDLREIRPESPHTNADGMGKNRRRSTNNRLNIENGKR